MSWQHTLSPRCSPPNNPVCDSKRTCSLMGSGRSLLVACADALFMSRILRARSGT